MSVVRAFPYLRYDPDLAGDPGQLLAPPYDVISESEREQLAALSPYNSVHIELPAGGDSASGAELMQSWVNEGVLEGGEVGIAIVQQRYVGPDGVRRTRIGVLCEVEIPPAGDTSTVKKHERTFDGPIATRLELMKQCDANVSPVFLLYHDPQRSLADMMSSITDDRPDFTSTDPDGTQAAVWFVEDPSLCDIFQAALVDHDLLIADGHHRFEAARRHRDEVAAAGPKLAVVGGVDHTGAPHTSSTGSNGVLAMVANSADEGILVFPTHRIVRGVRARQLDEFIVGSGAFSASDAMSVTESIALLDAATDPAVVVLDGEEARLLTLLDPVDMEIALPDEPDEVRKLDVSVLHGLLLEGGAMLADTGQSGMHGGPISYTRSLDEAVAAAQEDGTIVFLLREAPVEDIHDVANAGRVLPQKSTYFYPKAPTGVVYRPLSPLV